MRSAQVYALAYIFFNITKWRNEEKMLRNVDMSEISDGKLYDAGRKFPTENYMMRATW